MCSSKLTRALREKHTMDAQGLVQKCQSSSAFCMDYYIFKFILVRKLKCTEINCTCLYFSMVTRTFKLTYVAHIVFLLDRAPLENAKLEHELGIPRYDISILATAPYLFFPLRTMYISISQTVGIDKNS